MTAQSLTNKSYKGFTLIELLVVIGILAVLLAIVLIAINPARQFAQANDTKRRSDVNAILNAVDQYAADNSGDLSQLNIPSGTAGAISSTGVNICSKLVTKYLAALPSDPTTGSPKGSVTDCAAAYSTGYTIVKSSSDNRVTVSATGEIDLNTPITVTR